jgi:hypothetical protein
MTVEFAAVAAGVIATLVAVVLLTVLFYEPNK